MLADSSAFFIPSLESRRQAVAVGLTCKLFDGQGRGALSEVQPVLFALPTTKSTRSSDRLTAVQRAAGPQHPHQLKAAAIRHTGNRRSLVTYKSSSTAAHRRFHPTQKAAASTSYCLPDTSEVLEKEEEKKKKGKERKMQMTRAEVAL